MGYSSQNAQKSNQIGNSLKPSTSRSKGKNPKEEEGRGKKILKCLKKKPRMQVKGKMQVSRVKVSLSPEYHKKSLPMTDPDTTQDLWQCKMSL